MTLHMMSGTAVQRAFRGHLLVDQWLTCQSVAKIMEDDPGFQDQMKELEKCYTLMAIGKNYLQSDCICQIDKAIDTQK